MVAEALPTYDRVSKVEPCIHCGHPDWCLRGVYCDICMRVESDRPVPAGKGQGGWMHPHDGAEPRFTLRRSPAPSTPRAEKAGRETLDLVNRRILELSPLSDADRAYVDALHPKCGSAACYGTLPPPAEQSALMATLEREFGRAVLRTIPGVVERHGRLCLNGAGLLIGIYDVERYLVAFQVRYGPGDYRWLSTSGGPSSGAPAHIARPLDVRDHRIYMVESPKSANIIADKFGAVVIGLAGHANWRRGLEAAQWLYEHEGAEVIVIALDADDPNAKPATVAHVEQSRQHLAAALDDAGLFVKIARWSHADGKGFDDLLLNGHAFISERYRTATTATPDASMVCIDPAVLALLVQRTCATETLRRKYLGLRALIDDKRIKPSDKVLTAAVWDMVPTSLDGSPAPPAKIYRAALAERTGLALPTISAKLQDIAAMGLITREVRTTHTTDENTGQVVSESELWVGAGRLPDKALSAKEVNDLATKRAADKERKRRCPHCGSDHLTATMYICNACERTCTDDEAVAAGERLVETPAGTLYDSETGEILHPGTPLWNPDPLLRREQGVRIPDGGRVEGWTVVPGGA